MSNESTETSHLHLCKDLSESSSLKSPSVNLPSGKLSILKVDGQLYLRPSSPYRYHNTPELPEKTSSPSEVTEDLQFHQRSSTTIINDIAQSYPFIPAIQKTLESQPDYDIFSNTSEQIDESSNIHERIHQKNYSRRPSFYQNRNSTIQTISSSTSTENEISQFYGKKEWKSLGEKEFQHILLESVMAFCHKCRKNTHTEVIENVYVGTL